MTSSITDNPPPPPPPKKTAFTKEILVAQQDLTSNHGVFRLYCSTGVPVIQAVHRLTNVCA